MPWRSPTLMRVHHPSSLRSGSMGMERALLPLLPLGAVLLWAATAAHAASSSSHVANVGGLPAAPPAVAPLALRTARQGQHVTTNNKAGRADVLAAQCGPVCLKADAFAAHAAATHVDHKWAVLQCRRYASASAVLSAQKLALRAYAAQHAAKPRHGVKAAPHHRQRANAAKHATTPYLSKPASKPKPARQRRSPTHQHRTLLSTPVCGNGVCDPGESCR